MKNLKKKLATGFVVASILCGIGFNANASCTDEWHDHDMRILSCSIWYQLIEPTTYHHVNMVWKSAHISMYPNMLQQQCEWIARNF